MNRRINPLFPLFGKLPPMLLLLLIAALSGCGGKHATVSGVVTLDGQPAGPGVVMFHPANEADKRLSPAVGVFGDDGRYTLQASGNRPGCAPGAYIVTIVETNPETGSYGGEWEMPRKGRLPSHLSSYEHSGLTADVSPGHNSIDFPLSGK